MRIKTLRKSSLAIFMVFLMLFTNSSNVLVFANQRTSFQQQGFSGNFRSPWLMSNNNDFQEFGDFVQPETEPQIPFQPVEPPVQPAPAPVAPQMVTLTFNLNGGTISGSNSHSITINTGSTAQPPTPTRAGFTFNGWSPSIPSSVQNNMSFTALWIAVATPVAQQPAPSVTQPQTTLPGTESPVTQPPVTDPSLTQPSQYHELTFISHTGGDVVGRISVSNGTTLAGDQLPSTPTRTGFTFRQWYPNLVGQQITGPQTITGQWDAIQAPQTHTVTFELTGTTFITGSNVFTLQVNHNEPIPWQLVPNIIGNQQITPWLRSGQNFNTVSPVTDSFTLTSGIPTVQNNVTVTFVLNGGTFNNSTNNVVRSIPHGSTLANSGLNINPIRHNHILDNNSPWLLNGGHFNQNSPITSNITIVANWRQNNPQTHQVIFDLQGGSINGNTNNIVINVPHGNVINHIDFPQNHSNIVRNGFTLNFSSPWLNPNGTVFHTNTAITSPITLRANWISSNQVTVTFNTNGGFRTGFGTGSGNFTRSLPAGSTWSNAFPSSADSLSNWAGVTRSGFTFRGWYMQNGNQFTQSTTIPNNNFTLTASWTPTGANAVTLNFNPNGGTLRGSTNSISVSVARNQTFANSTGWSSFQNANLVPTRSGFTFGGWELPNGNLVNINSTLFNENITLIPRWNSNNHYTVSFNPNGGVWADNTTNNINRQIGERQSIRTHHNQGLNTFIPTVTRPGYSFDNWFIGNTNNVFTENTIVTTNMNIIARWIPINIVAPIAPAPQPLTPPVSGAPLVNHVVILGQGGYISAGGTPVNLSPQLGAYHINSSGVSVLPARAILSVLFGADPYDPYLFIWDANTSTLTIDPMGYNIRIQVGSQIMYVRNSPQQILSGEGINAFPYVAYVDPSDSRLYVPVRAIAEAVGFNVGWDVATGTVILTPPQN